MDEPATVDAAVKESVTLVSDAAIDAKTLEDLCADGSWETVSVRRVCRQQLFYTAQVTQRCAARAVEIDAAL